MIAGLRFFLVFACASAALSIGASAIAAHGLTLTAQDAQALAWALVWLVCVHMAAAAWHGWVLHDTTLKRIWFGR
jgi:cytochrome b561